MHTKEELKTFVKLPKGWHYGSGGPISSITVDIALELNEKAEGYGLKTEAFPGVDREILLCIYGWDENSLNLTIYYSDINYYLEVNDETVESEDFISVEDAYELIESLASIGE